MTAAAIIALLIVVGVVLCLSLTDIAPDAILMAALAAMLAVPVPVEGAWQFGVLSLGDALAGFSNPGLATVGILFVVATGLRETGSIDWIADRLLGRPKGLRPAICRTVLPVCGMSAFLNNTPVVAMMIPAVADWAKRLRLQPSKLMIPLSYGAILGGTCSLIGTSTNLVVNGLVIANTDMGSLGMFDITWIGLPCAIVGLTFVIFVGPKLLPNRGSATSAFTDPREYTFELLVPEGSPLAGKTVEQAGLRSLPGCFLVDIDRDGDALGAVGPDQLLHAGDRLIFAGVVEAIRDLQRLRGLAPATDQVFKLDAPRFRRRLFEAVISDSCPIVNKNIRNARFRNHYNGVVIAVARNGRRVGGKIGDIEIKPGDILLIEADQNFAERVRNSRDFLLVRSLEDSTPRRHARAPIAIGILLVMVVIAAAGWMDMLVAGMVASVLMIVTRCCTVSEARQSIDWSVLIVIGAALGIGRALDTTGGAQVVADSIIGVAGENPWLLLAAVYLVTAVLTEVITNNAAVALVFPIALSTARQADIDFLPFVMAIMIAASASFATPIGYQTNLMVYGPGGYRFSDFLRIGLPMDLLIAATAIGLIPLIWGF